MRNGRINNAIHFLIYITFLCEVTIKMVGRSLKSENPSKQLASKIKKASNTRKARKKQNPHRYIPGSVAMREIKRFLDPDLIIGSTAFKRLVREIALQYMAGVRFQSTSLILLQEATEAFLVGLFRIACITFSALFSKSLFSSYTLKPGDLSKYYLLHRRIQGHDYDVNILVNEPTTGLSTSQDEEGLKKDPVLIPEDSIDYDTIQLLQEIETLTESTESEKISTTSCPNRFPQNISGSQLDIKSEQVERNREETEIKSKLVRKKRNFKQLKLKCDQKEINMDQLDNETKGKQSESESNRPQSLNNNLETNTDQTESMQIESEVVERTARQTSKSLTDTDVSNLISELKNQMDALKRNIAAFKDPHNLSQ